MVQISLVGHTQSDPTDERLSNDDLETDWNHDSFSAVLIGKTVGPPGLEPGSGRRKSSRKTGS